MDFLSDLLSLPWEGAKIIGKIIFTSSLIVGTGFYFSQPETRIINNNIIIYTALINSYTPEIQGLIQSGTPVLVHYTIELKTGNESIYIRNFYKKFSFDIFEKKLSLYDSFNKTESIFFKKEDIDREFEILKWELCKQSLLTEKKILYVNIIADLTIDKKITEIKNLKLWNGHQPGIEFKLEAEKINGN